MDYSHARVTAVTVRHPIHAMLAPFPAVSFTLALMTDIAYWRTAHLMWHNFSAWLLFAGLVFGGLALLAALIELLFRPAVRAARPAWLHLVGTVIVLALAFINSLLHAGDGWTAIIPWGLVLSAVTVVLVLVTAWLGRPVIHRRDVEAGAYV